MGRTGLLGLIEGGGEESATDVDERDLEGKSSKLLQDKQANYVAGS